MACCSCRQQYNPTTAYLKQHGNFCQNCVNKINHKSKWRIIKHRVENPENIKGIPEVKEAKRLLYEKKLKRLTRTIQNRWGINMYEDDKRFKGLKESLNNL